MKRSMRVASVATALLLVLGACADEKTPADASFTLTVGQLTSFTGDLSAFGKPLNNAAKLAVDILNEALKANSSAITITLKAEDDQSTAQGAVEAANKLVSEGATSIIGALASASTVPVITSVAAPKKIVQISPASTSAKIPFVEDDGFFFRDVPSDTFQAVLLTRVLEKAFGKEATINTGARNDVYGTGLQQAFEENWKKNGGKIGQSVVWDPKAASFQSEADKLAGGDPDGWFIADFPETWKKVGTALQRTGKWDIKKTFTADGLKTSTYEKDFGASLGEGLRGTAPGAAKEGSAAGADEFDALWKAKGNKARQTFDAQTFDAAMVIGLAAIAAGSGASTDIRDNLPEVTAAPGAKYTANQATQAVKDLLEGKDIDYEGASGPIDFDDKGEISPVGVTYEVWSMAGGKITITETVDATTL